MSRSHFDTEFGLCVGEAPADVPPPEQSGNRESQVFSPDAFLPASSQGLLPERKPLMPGGLNFLVVGPPLSGKSTQASMLAERYDISATTIDDLLLVCVEQLVLMLLQQPPATQDLTTRMFSGPLGCCQMPA